MFAFPPNKQTNKQQQQEEPPPAATTITTFLRLSPGFVEDNMELNSKNLYRRGLKSLLEMSEQYGRGHWSLPTLEE